MVQAGHQRGRAMAGQTEGEGEFTVPQAAVVCTEIADDAEVVQKGAEIDFVHVVAMGYGIAISAVA